MSAGVFDAVARFVGEFAEIDFPGVGRKAKHVDVCAGTENAILGAGNGDGANFGMLEARALEGVVKLDVDPEVVGVELELVAGANAAIFGDVHSESGDGAIEEKTPVFVARRVGAKIDGGCGGLSFFCCGDVHHSSFYSEAAFRATFMLVELASTESPGSRDAGCAFRLNASRE